MSMSNSQLRSFCFSAEGLDSVVHFHVVLLPRHCFVWLGLADAKFSDLNAAIPTPYDEIPSCSNLMGASSSGEGFMLAQRLSLSLKMPVLCSYNLPRNSPLLQVGPAGLS
mmetsp:Transcript_18629/g.44504  ORF Transcript_18629/g.44504 Transcript_18629/m.44504 type:complete len:110 (-) Transcript_18629:1149-1478(-)